MVLGGYSQGADLVEVTQPRITVRLHADRAASGDRGRL
jgi:hypothetical protein